MNLDKLSSPRNNTIVVQLIKSTRPLTLSKDNSIHEMVRQIKKLSLINRKWYKALNSFDFTNMFIKTLTYTFHLKELYVANKVNTPGGYAWNRKNLEDMNFY